VNGSLPRVTTRLAQRFESGWIESILTILETVTAWAMECRSFDSIMAQAIESILAKSVQRLCCCSYGGDKSTQAKDIEQAKHYWNEYRRR
jgi:hypothetical protein